MSEWVSNGGICETARVTPGHKVSSYSANPGLLYSVYSFLLEGETKPNRGNAYILQIAVHTDAISEGVSWWIFRKLQGQKHEGPQAWGFLALEPP